MGLPLNTPQYYDNGGGIDLKTSATKVAENASSSCLNVDYTNDGAVRTRFGSRIQNISGGIPAQMAGAPRTIALYPYRKSDGTAVDIVCAGTTIKTSIVTPTNAITGLSALLPIPDLEGFVTSDDEYVFWGNGVDTNLKFNGTTWTNWSLARPAAPVPIDNGVGALGAGTYTYYYSFARTVGGVIVQEGELSPAGSLVLGVGRQIQVGIAVSADTQVNARVIYRVSPTSAGVAYRLTTVPDNVALFYNDNTLADGTIEAEFDNQAAPTTAIFEEYLGRMYIVDAAQKTDLYWSKGGKPWNVPTLNVELLDGPIKCLRRIFGALIIGTDRSLWVLNGDIETNPPRRVSSTIGILNNRCAAGKDILYFLGSNLQFYSISPTDFSQDEMRIENPLSGPIDPYMAAINTAALDHVCMGYLNAPDVSKVFLCCPIGQSTNNAAFVYNEEQSIAKKKPVWQPYDNLNISAIQQMTINNKIDLYSGDYNGFLWKLEDKSIIGDGAEDNGTCTAATANTLTDSSKTWVVNAFKGIQVRIIGGTGEGQVRTISSNTATQITVSSNWSIIPGTTSEYTIGGYKAYHFSNWKAVVGSYDVLKQLWFLWANANASGSYPIDLILQADFNQSTDDQIVIPFVIAANNAIWGVATWGEFIWGAQAVFQERFRQFLRFRSIRIGFNNDKAGQPFQINGFSIDVQNKGLFK